VFTGAVVCAGAALLPDADHHNGTIAHSVPVVGRLLTRTIGTAAGGHRRGLHSLLALAGVIALGSVLGLVRFDSGTYGTVPLGAGLATMALVAFATRALGIARKSWAGPWLLGLTVATGIIFLAPTEILWLPLAIGLGFAIHLLGDGLTIGGVPWLWPWKPRPPAWFDDVPLLGDIWQGNGHFALPVLGRAGSAREWLLGCVLTVYLACALVYEACSAVGYDVLALFN
jgi:membrane-bound metal-dependent hydrolase YbcI (DUF457 family)